MTTSLTTGPRKSLPDNAAPLPVRQRDHDRSAVAQVLAATTSDQVTLPRRWLETLLRPGVADPIADDGLAKPATDAAPMVGLSPSRLKRLAHDGLAPGAYREPGPRGRWMFPVPALRALQAAMRHGAHRECGRGGQG